MCGIVGFLDRTGRREVAKIVLAMQNALACRGPDSSGIAMYGQPLNGALKLRVKLGDRGDFEEKAEKITKSVQGLGRPRDVSVTAEYLRIVMDGVSDAGCLAKSLEALDSEIEVVSMGRSLEIVKQVGSPKNLDATYHVSEFTGTHALGHTRLSTESKIDLSHSQPFWAHGILDLAIVHNGHITNYHKMRRMYEQRGVKFYTDNDSEIIGVYLGERLSDGFSLEEGMRKSLDDLDGSFSYLAATADSLGFCKDAFAFKPLLLTESDDFVAIATEEIAVRSVLNGDYEVREAQVKEVHVWQR